MRHFIIIGLVVALSSSCSHDQSSTTVTGTMRPTTATPSTMSKAAPATAPAATTPLDEVGIPLYPGSTKVALAVSEPASNGSKRVSAEYSTTDDPSKVSNFYASKLGLNSASPPGTKLIQLVGKLPSGTFLQILVSPDGSGKSKIQYYFILMASK